MSHTFHDLLGPSPPRLDAPPDPVILPSGELAHVVEVEDKEPAPTGIEVEGPCSSCRDPGVCCRLFQLPHWRFPVNATREEVRDAIRDGRHVDAVTGEARVFEALDFEPVRPGTFLTGPGGREPIAVTWEFSCHHLDAEGRCSIYDRRPSLCRNYEPESTPLCREFSGPWRGWMRRAKPSEKDE